MDNSGGRWLTYAELARVRGIGRASAVKLVARERWPRSSGNDRSRTVRVLVPEDWLQPAKERPAISGDLPPGSADASGMLAAIENAHRGEIEALKGQVEALRTLADASGAKLVDAEARLAAAEEARRQARAEAQSAQERADALARAEDTRKARGRWSRLRAAWRGE